MNTLTEKEIKLVQDTWQLISPVSKKMGEEFYAKLFETHPELKPLFKSDPKDQAMKLMFMLSYLVHRLDSVDELKEEIKKLAVRHQNYGTHDQHYAPLGKILMWSLADNLGDHWTPETATAWQKTYDLIAHLMTEGSKK